MSPPATTSSTSTPRTTASPCTATLTRFDIEAMAISDAGPEQPRKSSGYRRLQTRHRALVAQHDALLAENAALLYQQRQLQQDVDRLLQQHDRLMQNAKAQSLTPWFQSANQVLAQLAAAP